MFKKPDLHQPTVTYNNQRKNLFIIKYGLTKDEYTQAKKMQRLNHDAWQKKDHCKRKADSVFLQFTTCIVCSEFKQKKENSFQLNWKKQQ